jgi:hypothetical protein
MLAVVADRIKVGPIKPRARNWNHVWGSTRQRRTYSHCNTSVKLELNSPPLSTLPHHTVLLHVSPSETLDGSDGGNPPHRDTVLGTKTFRDNSCSKKKYLWVKSYVNSDILWHTTEDMTLMHKQLSNIAGFFSISEYSNSNVSRDVYSRVHKFLYTDLKDIF